MDERNEKRLAEQRAARRRAYFGAVVKAAKGFDVADELAGLASVISINLGTTERDIRIAKRILELEVAGDVAELSKYAEGSPEITQAVCNL